MQAARRLFKHAARASYCRKAASRQQVMLCRHQAVYTEQGLNFSSASPDALPAPEAVGAAKVYSPKIEKLVADISDLTLLEVADLNELLKKTLNIQDAPMMAMGAMPAVQKSEEDEEEEAPKREKTIFTVKLIKFDAGKKVQLIKEIKNTMEGLNLVQAKKFVESVPQIVKADIPKEEAEKLKEALTTVGAEVEIE